MKKRKFCTFLRPNLNLRRTRKAEITGRHVIYAVVVIVLLGLAWPYLQAGLSSLMDRLGAPTPAPITDDGIYDIAVSRVNTQDLLAENADVTASAGYMSINGGSPIGATCAAGYMSWSGTVITEGDVLTIECQGSAAHYPQVRTFTVGDINEGTYQLTYYIIGTMELWGMGTGSTQSVPTVMTGTDLLFNGTAQEDQLDATGGTEYPYVINVNCDAFDEEYFGVEEYTQISGMKYTYVPAIYIKASTKDLVDNVAQDGVALKELYVNDDGTSHHYIFQFIPMREDEDIIGDGQYKITFIYTPDTDADDTLDITFHDETRLDRAVNGILSQTAVETIATLTTT